MDVSDAVWWIDQAMAKLEDAKRALTAMHYQSMAAEAAQQARPRTEAAEASEVKVGESIVLDGIIRKVSRIRESKHGRFDLIFSDGTDTYFDPKELLDVVVDTKLADEAANRAGLARTWAALRKPDNFDDAQAAHLAAGLAELGLEPR